MPDINLFFREILEFLLTCFSANVLTGLIPAFLLAGAVNVFVPPSVIFRFFGRRTNKALSYAAATFSGVVISV